MTQRKGIILAGGTGSRLHPLTLAANKQLLPIYDKPVIYYPLTTLMLAGIREILIISTPQDLPVLQNLFGSGQALGLQLQYCVQETPRGLPDAFILAEDFLAGAPSALILGDNFFHGQGLKEALQEAAAQPTGGTLFSYMVNDPSRYGIVTVDAAGRAISLEEKPQNPKSRLAITGLYFFDGSAPARAKTLQPSARGELEIVDLARTYLDASALTVRRLGRGVVWFDVGTPQALLNASNYVEVMQTRQMIGIACPEEVALRMGFISRTELQQTLAQMPTGSPYLMHLAQMLEES